MLEDAQQVSVKHPACTGVASKRHTIVTDHYVVPRVILPSGLKQQVRDKGL